MSLKSQSAKALKELGKSYRFRSQAAVTAGVDQSLSFTWGDGFILLLGETLLHHTTVVAGCTMGSVSMKTESTTVSEDPVLERRVNRFIDFSAVINPTNRYLEGRTPCY